MEKKLRENLSDLLIRQVGKEPKVAKGKAVGHPPVVELALKALKPKKRIQEYDKELVGELEEQEVVNGKHR